MNDLEHISDAAERILANLRERHRAENLQAAHDIRAAYGLETPIPRLSRSWPNPPLERRSTPRVARPRLSRAEAFRGVLEAIDSLPDHIQPLPEAARGCGCDSCRAFASAVAAYARSERD